MLVFNKGEEYIPMDQKTGPERIPKIVHQAWLGGKLPYAKQYFLDKAKRLLPNYDFILWTEENITQKNFPVAHDVIKILIAYQKSGKSAYKKYATIVDMMRHEITYEHGGFWRDAGLNIYKPVFDRFTKYKIAIGAAWTLNYRWSQGMCFYAIEPRS
jgi:mannosyltransferase OCH1-like enzyme